MAHSKATLFDMATDGYFGNVGRKDMPAVLAPFDDDAIMEVIGRGVFFKGKAAIEAHFKEFLEAYDSIAVEIFDCTVDETEQRMCTRFKIDLTSPGGAVHTMVNLNHFQVSSDGLIDYVRIYMSDAPRDGFEDGNSA